MAQYNQYYNSDVQNAQYGAYDASFPSYKLTDGDFTFDASHDYDMNGTWNMSSTGFDQNMSQMQGTNDRFGSVPPMGGWQQNPAYFGASNEPYLNEYNAGYLSDIANTSGRCPQQFQQESALFMQGMTMSSPVDINGYPANPTQYPPAWDSDLSITPPNEYHSSGSDGGSDDMSHQFLCFDSPKDSGSSRQTSASPPSGTIDVQPLPTPTKPSYYRNNLQKVASKATTPRLGVATPKMNLPPPMQACPAPIAIQKKKKSCSSCKKRKVGCGGAAPGHKCNQCERTGAECDIAGH